MRSSKTSDASRFARKRWASSALVGVLSCRPDPAASPRATTDALAPGAQREASTESVAPPISLDATSGDAAIDAAADVWEDAAPPVAVRVHPVVESLRERLLLNATPDVRYTLERVNISDTDRGAGRALYYALWDHTLRVMLPAALYRPYDWRWPRTRVVDDATLLSSASQYTDDAFTLDRAPSFDARCLSDTCPREAERRADCNTRPLDFVRGEMDATVLRLRTRSAAARDGGLSDGSASDGASLLTDSDVVSVGDASGAGASEWTDEEYCDASLSLITELTILTEVRPDCRSAESSSVGMLQAIAATARRRRRPAGTPVPLRDASVVVDP
ncbi:MAG: hypothetical protein JNK05_30520 [Myxococcales bacterium]|nr:hypothetical protein [Myxococcales bacterium]